MEKKLFDIPVVLIAYNRPEYVRRQIEILNQIRPSKLYFIVDGAPIGDVATAQLVDEVKSAINYIMWECDLEKIFADENMGCDPRIVTGLNEVFKKEKMAIILEDDCLPSLSFFDYCRECLRKYENDKDIMYISGTNWIENYDMKYSYGFSYNTGTWGWATWSRAWNEWNWDRKRWEKEKNKWLKGIYSAKYRKSYIKQMERYFDKKSIPWDYVWRFCVGERLSIFPKYNLIENVGFDSRATHTYERPKHYSGHTKEMNEILHPPKIEADFQYPKLIEKNERRSFLERAVGYIKRKIGK